MSKSPSESSVFKRSASHSLRSSFRLPRKRMNVELKPSCSSLPPYVPPKAAALLQISMPTPNLNQAESFNEVVTVRKFPEVMKVATIRRRSVWANSSASKKRSSWRVFHHFVTFPLVEHLLLNLFSFLPEISLPSNHEDDREERFQRLPVNQIFDVNRMHIGGFTLNKNLQENRTSLSETMNDGSSILKEINKNTPVEHFKVSKKHKLGHGAKRPEINVLCGELKLLRNWPESWRRFSNFSSLRNYWKQSTGKAENSARKRRRSSSHQHFKQRWTFATWRCSFARESRDY